MAYEPINFTANTLLTANQLKHMESGITTADTTATTAKTTANSALEYALKGNKSSTLENLADNSSFAKAHFIKQAGLNGKHGNTKYIGDRWYGTTSCTGEQHTSYMTLKNTNEAGTTISEFGRMCQKVYHNLKSKTVTVAARIKSNNFKFGLYYSVPVLDENGEPVLDENEEEETEEQFIRVFNTTTMSTSRVFIVTGEVPADATNLELRVYPYCSNTVIGSAELHWIALYEGSYTADTLPEYHAKNYVTELLECQRYFQRVHVQAQPCYIVLTGAAAYAGIRLPVPLYLDTSDTSTSKPTIYADYTIDTNNNNSSPVGILRYDSNTNANIQANSITFQFMYGNLLRLQFNWVKFANSDELDISNGSRVAMWNTGRFDLISPFD